MTETDDRSKGLLLIALAVVLTIILVGQYWIFVVEDESDDYYDDITDQLSLSIGFLEEVDSLNPYVGLNDASHLFYSLVYDGLMGVGPDLEPVPNLATDAWAVPESDPELVQEGLPVGSVWQYNLTTNAQWSDGEAFTADDVVYNLNLNAQNSNYLWTYQPYSYFIQEAVKVDDWTVRVFFWDKATGDPIPVAYGDSMFTPMLPKHKLETMDPADLAFAWTGVFTDEALPIVGTGPWTVEPDIYEQWLSGDRIWLVRNEDYHWGPDRDMEIQFGRLMLSFYQDPTAMTYALRNGELDVANFPPQAYRSISDGVQSGAIYGVETFDGPSPAMPFTYVGFNMNEAGPNPARLDKNIRHALAMATNRPFIIDNYYLGYADEGSTLIPPRNSYWHYEPNETERFDYDLDAARALLESSGYTDTNSDDIREARAWSTAVEEGWVTEGTALEFEIVVGREAPEEKDIAMYLKTIWEQIGVYLEVVIVDESVYPIYVYGYGYDLTIESWMQDVDPNYILFCQTQLSWFGWSDNKYGNESYNENYNNSVSAMDPAERKTYVDNCQRIFYQDVPYIILAYDYQTYAWHSEFFHGWGDWEAEPGRSLDSHWGGNPLFFELEPILSVPSDCADTFVVGLVLMMPTAILAAVFYALGIWYLVRSGRKKAIAAGSPEPGVVSDQVSGKK